MKFRCYFVEISQSFTNKKTWRQDSRFLNDNCSQIETLTDACFWNVL